MGELVGLACERHLRDLVDGPARGLHFDERAASQGIEFFPCLQHWKGEYFGQPFELAGWQDFIVGSLVGWKNADGLRRFRTAYIEVAKKNGKSALAAGIGLYLLVVDGEPGAEVYAAATKLDQARIVFEDARKFVLATPGIRRRCVVLQKSISFPEINGVFQVLVGAGDTTDGLNVHGAIVDEVHRHKTRAMLDVLNYGTAARRQPLFFMITTAGDALAQVCREQHDYTIKVVSGALKNDAWFGYVAALDKEDDWADERVWHKPNPGLGINLRLDDLRRQFNEASGRAAAQSSFRRLRLNDWVDASEAWLSQTDWRQGAGAIDLDRLAGRECFGGLDLSSKIDISAFVLTFPPCESDPNWVFLCRFFMPEETIAEAEHRDRVPYRQWVEDGHLIATDGAVVDQDRIKTEVLDLAERFGFSTIGYDPWNSTKLVTELTTEGFQMIELRQGVATLGAPSKEFEAIVRAGNFRYGDNPVMKWMSANVVVKRDDNDNLMPKKGKSTGRIDGIMGAIFGVKCWLLVNPHGEFTYEAGEMFAGAA